MQWPLGARAVHRACHVSRVRGAVLSCSVVRKHVQFYQLLFGDNLLAGDQFTRKTNAHPYNRGKSTMELKKFGSYS